MGEYVRLGTQYRDQYPMKWSEVRKGEKGYKFEKVKNNPLNEDLKDGVLVRRRLDDVHEWEIVDEFPSVLNKHDIELQYGVWKDKGFLGLPILKDGKIQKEEVTSMTTIFETERSLGWAGSDAIVGMELFGSIAKAFFCRDENKTPVLITDAMVERKTSTSSI